MLSMAAVLFSVFRLMFATTLEDHVLAAGPTGNRLFCAALAQNLSQKSQKTSCKARTLPCPAWALTGSGSGAWSQNSELRSGGKLATQSSHVPLAAHIKYYIVCHAVKSVTHLSPYLFQQGQQPLEELLCAAPCQLALKPQPSRKKHLTQALPLSRPF